MFKASREAIAYKLRSRHDPMEKQLSIGVSRAEYEALLQAVHCKNSSRFAKLSLIYQFVDKIYASMGDISVCQRGCSYCCAIDVSVTELEAAYLTKHTGVVRKRPKKETGGHKDYCPLLDLHTGECGVYQFRPFNCRTFVTVDDPKYCAAGTDTGHYYIGASGHGYGHPTLLQLALTVVGLNGDDMTADIRDYFGTSGVIPEWQPISEDE